MEEGKYRVFEKELSTRLFGAKITQQYSGRLDRLALLLHKAGYDSFMRFLKQIQGFKGVAQRLEDVMFDDGIQGDAHDISGLYSGTANPEDKRTFERLAPVYPECAH